ncbi:MAG: NUDIX hydrolase [Marinobacterium sp.]|nr:NUDIX hydrolase [Marinobacterium sp.]
MNFCSQCGQAVEQKVPAGDSRPRYVCGHCDTIHYQNPNIVAGCIPVHDGRILMCRRAIEPRYGRWTLPAGFMENGEAVEEAATRETREEACAIVSNLQLYTVTSIVHVDQVQMLYLADLPHAKFAAGEETLEVALFSEDEIPWDQLAFETIHNALEFYFADRKNGTFPLRHIRIERNCRSQHSQPDHNAKKQQAHR